MNELEKAAEEYFKHLFGAGDFLEAKEQIRRCVK